MKARRMELCKKVPGYGSPNTGHSSADLIDSVGKLRSQFESGSIGAWSVPRVSALSHRYATQKMVLRWRCMRVGFPYNR